MVIGGLILGFNIIQSSRNVIKVRRSKKLPIREALAGLIPFLALVTTAPIWLALRPIVLKEHLLPFMFFLGATFAYQVGLIIVAHLTQSPFPFFNVMLLPIFIFIGMLDSMGPFLLHHTSGTIGWPSALGDGHYQVGYVFLCMGLSFGIYGSFVVDVITNMCDYLDISCLTIKHKQISGEVERELKKQ